MSRTGIVIAMRSEAACITSQRNLPFDQAVPIDDHLVIRMCGMGPVAARRAAIDLYDQENVAGLISFGIAGALDDALQPGDLVSPESVQTKQSYSTDSAWRTRIERSLPAHLNIIRRPVAASDELVSTADEKYALAARSGACAVDMESGAIAAVASEKGSVCCDSRDFRPGTVFPASGSHGCITPGWACQADCIAGLPAEWLTQIRRVIKVWVGCTDRV